MGCLQTVGYSVLCFGLWLVIGFFPVLLTGLAGYNSLIGHVVLVWIIWSVGITIYSINKMSSETSQEKSVVKSTVPAPLQQELHRELAYRLQRMEQIKGTAYQGMGAIRQINDNAVAEVADTLRAVDRIRQQFGGTLPPEAANRLRELTWAAERAMDAIADEASNRIMRL